MDFLISCNSKYSRSPVNQTKSKLVIRQRNEHQKRPRYQRHQKLHELGKSVPSIVCKVPIRYSNLKRYFKSIGAFLSAGRFIIPARQSSTNARYLGYFREVGKSDARTYANRPREGCVFAFGDDVTAAITRGVDNHASGKRDSKPARD